MKNLTAEWILCSKRNPTNEYNTMIFRGGIPEPVVFAWYSLKDTKWYHVYSNDPLQEVTLFEDSCWLEFKLTPKIIKTNSQEKMTTENYMLDEVIKLCMSHGVANKELINKLAVQKIEYGRTCMAQIVAKTNGIPDSIKNYHDVLDEQLQKKIKECGGTPKKKILL